MTDPRTLIDHELERVEPPTFTLDGFHPNVRQVSQTGIFPAWQPLPEEG